MARSALDMSSSTVIPGLENEKPMLTVADTVSPLITMGRRHSSRMRPASANTSPGWSKSWTMTANSSPPSRAAVSDLRMLATRTPPIDWSSASPAEWPRRSLASFRPSMSRNRTATCSSVRALRSSAWSSRLRKSARLPRPVSESWNAWYDSSSASRSRSVTSWPDTMSPPTEGSSTRLTRASSKGTARGRPRWIRWTVTVTGVPDPAPSAARSSAADSSGRSRRSTRSASGRPSTTSGSWPSMRVRAPEHDMTVPSGATSMVTTAAFWTTARNRASSLKAISKRRRSVRSRSTSRTQPSPYQGTGEPSSSTRRQPDGVRTRTSMDAPISLCWMLSSERTAKWRSSGCTNSRPETPTVSWRERPNSRSAVRLTQLRSPAAFTTTTASGSSRSMRVRSGSHGSSARVTGSPPTWSSIPASSASPPVA